MAEQNTKAARKWSFRTRSIKKIVCVGSRDMIPKGLPMRMPVTKRTMMESTITQ